MAAPTYSTTHGHGHFLSTIDSNVGMLTLWVSCTVITSSQLCKLGDQVIVVQAVCLAARLWSPLQGLPPLYFEIRGRKAPQPCLICIHWCTVYLSPQVPCPSWLRMQMHYMNLFIYRCMVEGGEWTGILILSSANENLNHIRRVLCVLSIGFSEHGGWSGKVHNRVKGDYVVSSLMSKS